MALMFQRLARNYIKNGYFPTDGETIEKILEQLSVSDSGNMVIRLFDPCCGEGTALAELAHRLSEQARVPEPTVSCHAYGIEIDAERVSQARQLLDTAIHSDLTDCFIGRQQFSVLFLNPPYGETVSDKASISGAKTQRLELRFFKDTVNSLVFGGILILIIPAYSLDKAFANRLIQHFDRLRVYRAETDQFKQVVVMGVKKRVSDRVSSAEINDIVTKGKDWQDVNPFPYSPEFTYGVPNVPESPKLFSMTITGELLELEPALKGVWPHFKPLFGQHGLNTRRPLTKMSDWHMALALTSGQVNGRVTSTNGRTLLIKGDTYKIKKSTTTQQFDDDGNPREIRTAIDAFVPAITGIDVTPGSDAFGTIVTIQ